MSRSQKASPTEKLREAIEEKPKSKWGESMEGTGQEIISRVNEDGFPNTYLLRSFCTSPAIPWCAFNTIQSRDILLNDDNVKEIVEDFTKQLTSSHNSNNNENNVDNIEDNTTNTISDKNRMSISIKSVSKFLEKQFPELCPQITKDDIMHRGATFLLFSVVTGNLELAQRCLELEANPNDMSFLTDLDVAISQMPHGYSPMFMSIILGNIEMMNLLHKFGGSLHVYDRWGRTPLHAALAIEKTEVVEWLIEKGAPRCIGSSITMLPDNITITKTNTINIPDVALPNPALQPRPKPCNAINELTEMCHCHSGKPKGYCGCVDDMFLRWSYDRLHSRWQSGMNFSTLAATYTTSARNRTCVG